MTHCRPRLLHVQHWSTGVRKVPRKSPLRTITWPAVYYACAEWVFMQLHFCIRRRWSLFLKVLLASVVIQRRGIQKMREEMKARSCQCPGATFLCKGKTCGINLWKRKIPRSATVIPSEEERRVRWLSFRLKTVVLIFSLHISCSKLQFLFSYL